MIQGVLEMQWIRWIRMNCPFNLEREGESYETNVIEETCDILFDLVQAITIKIDSQSSKPDREKFCRP